MQERLRAGIGRPAEGELPPLNVREGRDLERVNPREIKCGIFVAVPILLVVLFVLLLLSVGVVHPRRHAIKMNWLRSSIYRGDVHANGRYLVGPFASFIPFEKGFITYVWSDDDSEGDSKDIGCWTKSGQNLGMSFSIQLRFNSEALDRVYFNHGSDVYTHMRVLLQSSVQNTCSEFDNEEFFTSRERLSEAIMASVAKDLAKEDYATLTFFQLREIRFPQNLQFAVLTKLLKRQAEFRALFEQEVAVKKTELTQIREEAEALASVTFRNATASGDFEILRAVAAGEREIDEARGEMMARLLGVLGISESQRLQVLHYFIHQGLGSTSSAARALPMVDLRAQGTVGLPR